MPTSLPGRSSARNPKLLEVSATAVASSAIITEEQRLAIIERHRQLEQQRDVPPQAS